MTFPRFTPLLLACSLLLPAARATTSGEDIPLTIAVRSSVDRPFQGLRKAPLKEHGKLYHFGYIQETLQDVKLVRPVDEGRLRQLLAAELTKRGFREATGDEAPDIVLTVHYGRGLLHNPYLNDTIVNENTNPPTVTIIGGVPTQLMRQKEHNFEMKLQNANFEKLFIRVTAWANPAKQDPPKPGRKPKPKALWKTTIVIDDPAGRDLNHFMEKMLAAGANYFDREIAEEEALIRTDLPEGHVELGEAKVVDDKRKP